MDTGHVGPSEAGGRGNVRSNPETRSWYLPCAFHSSWAAQARRAPTVNGLGSGTHTEAGRPGRDRVPGCVTRSKHLRAHRALARSVGAADAGRQALPVRPSRHCPLRQPQPGRWCWRAGEGLGRGRRGLRENPLLPCTFPASSSSALVLALRSHLLLRFVTETREPDPPGASPDLLSFFLPVSKCSLEQVE